MGTSEVIWTFMLCSCSLLRASGELFKVRGVGISLQEGFAFWVFKSSGIWLV